MADFIELKPFTEAEIAQLRSDYQYAVTHLDCQVTFEVYVGLIILDQLM